MMYSMLPSLTDERPLTLRLILSLAPDHATLRAAEALAESDKWAGHGSSPVAGGGRLLWAAFPEGKRADTRTIVHLSTFHFGCTCASVRFPCRHAIALLLRDATCPPEAVVDAPEWAVTHWKGVARAGRSTAGDDTAEEADSRRLAAMRAGLAELARWLDDQMRQGLATLPRQGRQPWLAVANRLVDAYAFDAAREVRELAALPGSAPDWPERLLPRLGLLALLAEGFDRLESLPPGERGDVLAAAGWPLRPGDDRVSDEWLVLGRRQHGDGRQRRLSTWLYGLESGRWALLEEFRPARRIEGVWLPTGGVSRATLAFRPSAAPLPALPEAPLTITAESGRVPKGLDITAGIAAYAAARAANPWLRRFPLLLADVIAEPAPEGWRLRDQRGRLLPLPERFAHGWQLLALAGDRPVVLFGEWDGSAFTPLSVAHDGWHDMGSWKSQT